MTDQCHWESAEYWNTVPSQSRPQLTLCAFLTIAPADARVPQLSIRFYRLSRRGRSDVVCAHVPDGRRGQQRHRRRRRRREQRYRIVRSKVDRCRRHDSGHRAAVLSTEASMRRQTMCRQATSLPQTPAGRHSNYTPKPFNAASICVGYFEESHDTQVPGALHVLEHHGDPSRTADASWQILESMDHRHVRCSERCSGCWVACAFRAAFLGATAPKQPTYPSNTDEYPRMIISSITDQNLVEGLRHCPPRRHMARGGQKLGHLRSHGRPHQRTRAPSAEFFYQRCVVRLWGGY